MSKQKFLVLGCGNMAQALALSFFEREKGALLEMSYYTPSKTKAEELAKKTAGKHLTQLEGLEVYDYVMIACKPQQFADLATSLKAKLKADVVVVSIMAGISAEHLKQSLAASKIVRVMPNTPSLIGEGSNLVYYTDQVTNSERTMVERFLKASFAPHLFEHEKEIDQITGVIASGPAYVFEFARLMVDYLVKDCSLPEDRATQLVKELFTGSSHLMMNSKVGLEELRNQVTSKGGVTFAALESFRENKLADTFSSAFKQAYKRTQELSQANSASK